MSRSTRPAKPTQALGKRGLNGGVSLVRQRPYVLSPASESHAPRGEAVRSGSGRRVTGAAISYLRGRRHARELAPRAGSR